MNKLVFCVDLHGVLVNSTKMIDNYESVLVEIYKKYNISAEDSLKYHNEGLKQFREIYTILKTKNLTGKQFLSFMNQADKEWDRLMQGFIPNKNVPELESRNVEYLAGKKTDTFYPDGKKFLQYIDDKANSDSTFDYFIVSNSHTSHIKGLLDGAGLNSISTNKLLGWDKLASLKHQTFYYNNLNKLVKSDQKIIIGNSRDEMVLGKKSGYRTVFISREFNRNFDFNESIDFQYDNLNPLNGRFENIFS